MYIKSGIPGSARSRWEHSDDDDDDEVVARPGPTPSLVPIDSEVLVQRVVSGERPSGAKF
jgi:hypothetical protein